LQHFEQTQGQHRKSNFGTFTTVMFEVEVFWVVPPCSVLVGYRRFRVSYYLHLQYSLKRWYPTYHNTTRHHNPEDLDLKLRSILRKASNLRGQPRCISNIPQTGNSVQTAVV